MNPKSIVTKDFINNYWQKKPFVFKKPNDVNSPMETYPISIANVIDLLQQEDVESKVVFTRQNPEKLEFETLDGPFNFDELKDIDTTTFTYLIQDINQELFEVDSYYSMFQGLACWQQANVMVSYSNNNGSVGPHRDRYDVFLWQTQGERKWYLENTKRPNEVESKFEDIEILEDFKKDNEIILQEGDILYIPSNIAHWGVSQSESVSLSFAFRRPSVYDYLMYMISEDLEANLLSDEHLPAPEIFSEYDATCPNKISDQYSNEIIKLLEVKIMSLKKNLHKGKSAYKLAQYLGEQSNITQPYENLPLDNSMMLNSDLIFFPGIRQSYVIEKKLISLFIGFEKFEIEADVALAEYICKHKQFSVTQLLKASTNPKITEESLVELCKAFVIGGVCFLK